MAAEVHAFQTKVSKLLKLLANSLYSNKEVFLRELVSNASDAIDKLRFESISHPELLQGDPAFAVRIRADKEAGTLTISDNGIGMTLEQANQHLGTIAQSGTEDFLEHLSADQAKDAQQIGQFGVGFYSAFIVADKVTVVSRAAGAAENEAVKWESDGSGTFTSELTTRAERGTDVILHMKKDEETFLMPWTLRETITKYSDHISVPVYLFETKPAEKQRPEVHEKYIDVQFLASGKEKLGFTPDTGNYEVAERDDDRDLIFYKEVENEGFVEARPGCFSIFFPEDVHRPACASGESMTVRKVVIKVSVDLL